MAKKYAIKSKTKGSIMKTSNGNIYYNINDTVYVSKDIKRKSWRQENFNTVSRKNLIIINIPATGHSWRINNIDKFIKDVPRQYTSDEVCYSTRDVLQSKVNKNQIIAI